MSTAIGNRRTVIFWLIALAALHLVVACAGFFAPYDPTAQDRDAPYLPPAHLHWVDSKGSLHFRPFFFALHPDEKHFGEYEQDRAQPVPLRFFISGPRYRLFGVLPTTVHLFGTNGAKIFLFGTDAYGRDVFSRTLYGGQISLLAGFLATLLTLVFGFCIGGLAGFAGGWADEALMRLSELFMALPWLYLLFAIRAFLPLSLSPLRALFLVIIVIGSVGWARPARLIRGVVLSGKERDYVRASRGFGASRFYLMRRHILPQTSSVVLTQATILLPQYILAEVTLSFLGLGVAEPMPSWGNLLSSLQQYNVLASYWWMYLPGLATLPFFAGYLALASSMQKQAEAAKI
jgi:peptide/nickel transport system permease protein